MSDDPTRTPQWGGLTSAEAQSNEKWWPNQLNLRILAQNHPASNPLGGDFDYAEAVAGLDFDALTRDVDALMTDSQDWWPADWGHYGGLFIRMAWHAAGTYRVRDGRGGAGNGSQRFAPLNSWPDNGNLDKARRLLLPIKLSYGRAISWADLIVFAGNRALETMGFSTLGFAFGRADIWAPEDDVYWGPEDTWLGDERYSGDRDLAEPLAAVQMGLIYVNPQGPNGVPDALGSARDIRETFARMSMNDEETLALTVGGHTFGKMHGNGPESAVGAEPEGAGLADQGLGWINSNGTGKGEFTFTSGLEGAWTPTPTQWDNSFLETLFAHEWEVVESPGGAKQWQPREVKDGFWVPDAHVEGKMNPPAMTDADMALIVDPGFREIAQRFRDNPDQLADAFARAWFKLLHRDMGPTTRYVGPLLPAEDFIWQDNVPPAKGSALTEGDIAELKRDVLESGLGIGQLVGTAWASASTYRRTDYRGGANGARIRLEPQAGWDVNVSAGVAPVIAKLEEVRDGFNSAGGSQVSLADLIVLGGTAALEAAGKAAGHDIRVPFHPGRTDADQASTDVESFGHLEPAADGFRNYVAKAGPVPAEHMLVDRAYMLNLSAPEMTALVGAMRVLGANVAGDSRGVLTDRVGVLSTDFFTNLVDMGTEWLAVGEAATGETSDSFEGRDRANGDKRWTASRVDLAFGSNAQLRAIVEEYAAEGGEVAWLDHLVAGWVKVMDNDRFDLGH
ncbi:MAG: catalase/peroxidase HPI [Microthrixaceae bacterium]